MAKKVKRKVVSTSAAPVTSDSGAVEVFDTPATSQPARGFVRRVPASQEFNPDYRYVVKDLKRIGALAGTFFVLLIALSFVLPMLIK